MARLSIKKETLRDLSIRSKNQCAFPGCSHPLLNAEGIYIAELCHIEAAEPGGQRFNPHQTDEERRSIDNLLFLCHRHHKETDDESEYTVARLREIKRAHEALPDVVFDSALLLQRLEEIAQEQASIRSCLQSASISNQAEAPVFPIVGPELREEWTPEHGRFYTSKTGPDTSFRYMMRDGWLHIEQVLPGGGKAYYEVNNEGSVRASRMPHALNEYRIIIPPEIVLHRETLTAKAGAKAVKTTLKWSLGHIVEHYQGETLVQLDCQARCTIDQATKTISVVAPGVA